MQAYDSSRDKELLYMVQDLDQILRSPEEHCEHKVALAERIAPILIDAALPGAFLQAVQTIRDRPSHPDCEFEDGEAEDE